MQSFLVNHHSLDSAAFDQAKQERPRPRREHVCRQFLPSQPPRPQPWSYMRPFPVKAARYIPPESRKVNPPSLVSPL